MTQILTVPLELKSLGEREIEGHGSVFNNVDLGGDIIVKGAFKRSLAAHRKAGTLPQMFWMHDPSRVPGKWVEMGEDDRGLAVRGVLADTELGKEMRTLANMKAVRGLSIGYVPKDVDFDEDGNRIIKEIDLWEVSLVSLAMNPLARIEASKSRLSREGEYVPTVREFEHRLRDAGFSARVRKMMTAKFYDGSDGMSGGGQPGDEGFAEILRAIDSNTGSFYGAALTR